MEGELVETSGATGNPARLTQDRELAHALIEGMETLSETLRTTLVMVSLDGMSHAEAALVLGCPEGTVAWRVHEARRKLRVYLESRGHAPKEAES
jgi:RNA polymerase sigma-70 factor (ECF subfamily)